MIIYELTARKTTGVNRGYMIWIKDSRSNIIAIGLDRCNDPTEEENVYVNNTEFGFEAFNKMLKGEYIFDLRNRSWFNSKLIIDGNVICPDDDNFYRITHINYVYPGEFGIGETSSHTLFGIKQNRDNVLHDVHMYEFDNVYERTFQTKRDPQFLKDAGKYYAWIGFVNVNGAHTPAFICTRQIPDHKILYVGFDDAKKVQTTKNQFFGYYLNESFPKCTIKAVHDSDNSYTITATCMYNNNPLPNNVLYFQTTGGYINKQRSTTDSNGQCTIKLIPLGLEKGDVVNVQCGFRLFTGIADTDITIE